MARPRLGREFDDSRITPRSLDSDLSLRSQRMSMRRESLDLRLKDILGWMTFSR